MSLLEIDRMRVAFGHAAPAVDGVSLRIERGECLALVGESGSGKSVTSRALLGLAGRGARVTAETFRIDGVDAIRFGEREWRGVRGRAVSMVLQDALVSLDPLRRVGAEIDEALRVDDGSDRSSRKKRAIELLAAVGVPEPERRAAQYPHELSGGLRQRALIASALASDPALLVADEPTTALDVLVQRQILELLGGVTRDGRSVLLVSHDLAVVATLADRIAVMRGGRIVETGTTSEILENPQHEYTRTLIAAARPTFRPASPTPTAVAPERIVVQGVSKAYRTRTVVEDVHLTLRAGRTLGVLGESGSGKTTLARLILGLAEPDRGTITLDGAPWSRIRERERRPRRRTVQLIPQDPFAAFDPRSTVGAIIAEAPWSQRPSQKLVAELLTRVGLHRDLLGRRPAELSGGQRQRVAIARALGAQPEVLVCDEPVSALDASIRAQVLELLAGVQDETGVAMLFITHDVEVARQISHDLLVMKDGRIVESGTTVEVFRDPRHPYTRSLLEAAPALPVSAGRDAALLLAPQATPD